MILIILIDLCSSAFCIRLMESNIVCHISLLMVFTTNECAIDFEKECICKTEETIRKDIERCFGVLHLHYIAWNFQGKGKTREFNFSYFSILPFAAFLRELFLTLEFCSIVWHFHQYLILLIFSISLLCF
jgi:hypothetical protein